ncbi:hypothetical protein GU926_06220 [Nibribacter ruber]|uniref:YcxB-like C-terminal domain-containing protein n=1 Tax=Nibribacter ruber TaxID=2698458 RepID=A0A6P1P0V0_9BACT|nr:YcxB family protein [Nibribacter ruber]QHL87053.1 hypothetical protein GU926_06220 [Nibribacter ruber]
MVEQLQVISRKEKILAFIHDYYVGYGKYVTAMRIFAGPIMLLGGLVMDDASKIKWAVILYAIYYILKPFLWFLFRLSQYKTEEIAVTVTEEALIVQDSLNNESKIVWNTFQEIKEQTFYFLFIISSTQRIRIPKRILTEAQMQEFRRRSVVAS